MNSEVSSSGRPFHRWCGYLIYFIIAALPLSFAIADILLDLEDYQTYRVRREFTGYCEVVLIALLLWGALKSWRVFNWCVLALMAVPLLVLLGHFLFNPYDGPADEIARCLWRWTLIFLFALVFYGAVAGRVIDITVRGMVIALVVGAFAYAVFALTFHFGLGHLAKLKKNDLLGFGNVRASTRLFVPALMCAIISFALPFESWRRRYAFLAAALFISILSGYTGSRSTIFALVSVGMLAALLSPGFRHLRIAATTVGVIAFGLLIANLIPPVIQWLSTTEPSGASGSLSVFRYSSSGRTRIWNEIIELSLQQPIFGFGGVDYATPGIRHLSNAHNIVLQIFYEVGLVGWVAMATLATLFLLRVLKIVRAEMPDPYVTAMALAACAIMADALVSPALWFQYSAFLFVVLTVMTLAGQRAVDTVFSAKSLPDDPRAKDGAVG
ncbi:O-antigen ligase [Notoacmeibacter sp. MSK16QG-6]|uniref:O-antigen ligase family protein n=1 Tax=Notoacmeibacter sp. MSK16QG-6 TaxID=2957982 RepID=UPI00209E304A|nr:O-antigen ligase family protein [Notoacmeibacter sp. MSK16QG-6]MCP1199272.1 O-antigen ligase family protein [Notoacmeibacter sp. MSK16QG-6]